MAELILRPDSTSTAEQTGTPSTGANMHLNVDESTINEADYNYGLGAGVHQLNLYGYPNTTEAMSISKVTLYAWLQRVDNGLSTADFKFAIKIGGTVYYDTEFVPLTSTTLYSWERTTKPSDSSAWTRDDIDALLAGDANKRAESGKDSSFIKNYMCWVKVDYTIPTPDPPTNFAASENDSTKVVSTWTKSTGATGYKIYRDANLIDTVGDVATHDDTAAAAPVITPGSAVASDGASTAHVALSLSGNSIANGTQYTYKVRATNDAGDSGDSNTDTGYRLAGSLNYQWQRSVGDVGEVTAEAVTPVNLRISVIDGNSFVGFSESVYIPKSAGVKITVKDSAARELVGYGKAAGTEEVLSEEIGAQ